MLDFCQDASSEAQIMPDGCQILGTVFGCFKVPNYARSGTQVASVATLRVTKHSGSSLKSR